MAVRLREEIRATGGGFCGRKIAAHDETAGGSLFPNLPGEFHPGRGVSPAGVNLPLFQKRSVCAGLAGQDLDDKMPPSSFSETSPVCYRPVFDGIEAVWFTATVVKKAFDDVRRWSWWLPWHQLHLLTQGFNLNAAGLTPVLPFGLEFCYSVSGKGKKWQNLRQRK